MAYYPQKSSIQAVVSWYEDQDRSPFVIFRNSEKFECARYTGTDKQEGIDRLMRYLNDIEITDYNIYCLKILPGTTKKDQSAPSITFQLYKQSQQMMAGIYQPQNNQAMNEILSEIRAMRAERMMDDEDDDEEEQKPETLSQVIAGIIKQPQVMNVLLGALMGLGKGSAVPKSNVLAGVEVDEVSKSIEILFSKGVTAEDLQRLAAMDQGQINFLLSMLRK